MDENKQQIINLLSTEISRALISCEYSRHEEAGNIDKIEAHMNSYATRVKKLRAIREQLEDEFTIMHYDPR